MSIAIEPAGIADVQAIAEMSRRLVETGLPWTWTPARVARHLHDTNAIAITSRHGVALCGFALMHVGDESAHLNLLAVDHEFQRQGLGRRMIDWLETTATTAGVFTITLEVRARNPVGLLFYRRMGYRETGRLARYYSGREDGVGMSRDLRAPGTRHLRPPAAGCEDPPRRQRAMPDWLERFRR